MSDLMQLDSLPDAARPAASDPSDVDLRGSATALGAALLALPIGLLATVLLWGAGAIGAVWAFPAYAAITAAALLALLPPATAPR